MPSKVWAVGEEVLAADFNDYVQEQVVSTFANAAARDLALPTPNVGQTCFLQDALGLFYFDGTAWRALPKGRLAYLVGPSRDATQGLSLHAQVSFTLPVARLVRVDGYVNYSQITAASNSSTYCNVGFDGGRNSIMAITTNLPLSSSMAGLGSAFASLAAGPHTAELHLVNNSTVGAMRVLAGAGGSWVAVTDVGGV